MKKASLSFQTIIIAVLGVIVLLVLVFMIKDKTGDLNKATGCPGACEDSCEPNEKEILSTECKITCCFDLWPSGSDD